TNPATHVMVNFNAVGNGIQLTDPTAPATPGAVLQVEAINASSAPGQLGLLQTAASATPGVINGADVNGLMPRGLFSSLTKLRDALNSNDTAGIQRAAALLDQDYKNVSAFHGQVGAREQDISSRQDQNTNDQTALKQSLSLLNDTDMTTAITQFQALQTAYNASLKAASSTQNLSLLDFLK
ncbi:MAG: flagellin, partial [Phycisphaerae bacterium]